MAPLKWHVDYIRKLPTFYRDVIRTATLGGVLQWRKVYGGARAAICLLL